MKYFICALDKVSVGIPAEQTERIIPLAREQAGVYETESQPPGTDEAGTKEAFISLPALLHDNTPARHGLVLKSAGEASASRANIKTILLSPKIDIDIEIPDESIHRLPEAFAGIFSFFSGACFAPGINAPGTNDESGQNLILIVNPQKLMEVYNG